MIQVLISMITIIIITKIFTWFIRKINLQAGAELGQAQVKLEAIYEVVVEVRSWSCSWGMSSMDGGGGRLVGGWEKNEINAINCVWIWSWGWQYSSIG